MKELIKRSYQAIVGRGLITKETTKEEFLDKILEEFDEAYYETKKNKISENRYVEELTDLATVCIMQITHLGYDFEKEFESVVNKNEKRASNEQRKTI